MTTRENEIKAMRIEHIDLSGAFNARDLGGYRTHTGGQTKRGIFFRSGLLHTLTDVGQAVLSRKGVTRIIDLRADYEIAERPDRLTEGKFERYHVPLEDALNAWDQGKTKVIPDTIAEMYTGLLEDAGDSFAHIFSLFATAKGGTLFHCTHGKDRTGMTAMLLLEMAGVPDEIIVADYECSQVLVPRSSPRRSVHTPAYTATSPPEAIREVLRFLRQRFGGAREYLLANGADSGELTSILERFVSTDPD